MVIVPAGTGVHLLRATSLTALADAVATELSTPLSDPFATEVVAVPAGGLQRWIGQQLAQRLGSGGADDGICAGVDFPTLPGLVAQVEEQLGGRAAGTDPWRPEHACWAVLDELDAARDEPWARWLLAHVGEAGDPLRPGRRMATAARVARLFHTYSRHRPGLLSAWAGGADVDATGQQLAASDRWQPQLWRRLVARLGTEDPVARRAHVVSALEGGARLDLPDRLVVLCPARSSVADREVVAALGRHRRVLVGLVDHAPVPVGEPSQLGEDRRGAGTAQHRLNRRLGRAGVEERELWRATADTDTLLAPEPDEPGTLLARLQRDVAEDTHAGARPRLRLAPDASLQVHASHGPDRQVEVLREVLVGTMQEDPTLEPRDVVVLCPDLRTFAPLLAAVLAPGDDPASHPGHRLRVRVADRTFRQTNPVLQVLAEVMELAPTRFEASRVLDLAMRPPVAARFGFSEEDLEDLQRLVRASGVRWGLDAGHRQAFGLGGVPQNTWRAGLDRMLAGVAMTDEELVPLGRVVLPLDEVSSSEVDLVGRLAELVARLARFERRSRGTHTAREWVEILRETVTDLTDARGDDAWQLVHAYSELADVAETVPDDGAQLGLGDARVMLADALAGMAPRASFGAGHLVVCSPDQLRHVPHRVVVGLGFDDAVFPRPGRPDGDDLLARAPQAGDPDPRAWDRQLLLDALMSATERLVLVVAGADRVRNAAVPPAVAVAELLDAVDDAVDLGAPAREALRHDHPLHPFSPAAFSGEVPSFDEAAARGARALTGVVGPVRDRWPTCVLPALPAAPVLELAELDKVLHHPIKGFLRARAGLSGYREQEPSDEMPLEPDGLAQWGIGERVLRRVRRGDDVDEVIAAEWLRGDLPPRARGSRVLASIREKVLAVHQSAGDPGPATHHDIELPVAGRVLRGVVTTHGDAIVDVSYSRPNAGHRLGGWLRLLALQAMEPGTPWRWMMHGSRGSTALGPVRPDWTEPVLANLVELYDMALCQPLPFLPALSERYAGLVADPASTTPVWKAMELDRWGNKSWDRDTDATFRRFYPDLAALRQTEPVPSDSRRHAEPSRFGTLARRVFDPLMEAAR